MFLVLILSTHLKISKHIKQYAIREAARNSQNNPNLPKNCICIMMKPIYRVKLSFIFHLVITNN